MFASICLRVLSRIQRGGARLVTDFTPKPPELQATFERQHRYCRQCHPELGRDWLRAGTWGAALAGSLLFWCH
jgi:hypothetical protein